MAEYIERETLLERAEYDNNYRLIIPAEAIKDAPAADVAPVIHARWVQASNGVIYCFNCGAVCGIGAHIEEVTEDHYFCYYCGAKMDEDDIHE